MYVARSRAPVISADKNITQVALRRSSLQPGRAIDRRLHSGCDRERERERVKEGAAPPRGRGVESESEREKVAFIQSRPRDNF